jgi:hypothetical protein
MDETLKVIDQRIAAIAEFVSKGRAGRTKPWGGADVVICSKPVQQSAVSGSTAFYPDKRQVVSPFAEELSWLFESLRDAFGSSIDFQSKYEFYARLADASDRYSATTPETSRNAEGLLLTVLSEAKKMATELP